MGSEEAGVLLLKLTGMILTCDMCGTNYICLFTHLPSTPLLTVVVVVQLHLWLHLGRDAKLRFGEN